MNSQFISRCSVSDRDLYFLSVPQADLFPKVISVPSKHFAVFLALDATGLDHIVISNIVRPLLRAGAVYFCCYGPDCDRVHDAIDWEVVDSNIAKEDDGSVIMTTGHERDSLIEALWFFVFNAFPADKYLDECKAGLAISCGNPAWDQQITADLKNLAEKEITFDESGVITGFKQS
jgi:hypothetical protein